MLRFYTAGESHGEALTAVISGIPAGLKVDQEFIDRELWRRQQGYGRGGRMKIERDAAHILSGVRHGITIGSPISIQLENRDWKNWQEALPVEKGDPEKHRAIASPRPGHADLAGALKYNFPEARYILERASARESAARVAVGAIAKLLLRQLEIEVLSHVIAVGAASLEGAALGALPITLPSPSSESDAARPQTVSDEIGWEQIRSLYDRKEVMLNCADPATERAMIAQVDRALKTGDSVGGVFEVVAHNVPPGLGSYANWDERLDARLAAAVMSLQAVKAVEIGSGINAAASFGSAVHDEIGYHARVESSSDRTGRDAKSKTPAQPDKQEGPQMFTRFTRAHNHAGGIEGGISNGQDVIVRGYLKPISTLRRPLGSVDFKTREPVKAAYERSDVCVVPAAGIAGESMVALTLAAFALEKFGGDSIGETERNFHGYCRQIQSF